jgi:hypothetical protein
MFLLLAFACGPKTETTAVATSPTSGSAAVPGDKASRAFSERLMGNPIPDFRPTDALGGGDLMWNKLAFTPDMRWEATAVLKAAGESIDCMETGEWTMPEAAAGAGEGSIVLTTKRSTCPGRPNDGTLRLLLRDRSGAWDVVVR